MGSKNRFTLIDVSLVICILVTLALEFWLSRSGQAVLVSKADLPAGITIEHDKLQGYKILEEGFIHILDEHTILGEDTINAILAYHATEDDVFVKSSTATGKTLYLNIHVLESSTHDLEYELKYYKSEDNEDWIDISNKENIRFIVTLRNILVGMILTLLMVKLFGLLRKVTIRRA